ncbi:hypothetical protein IKL64_08195 [bacterium]|nr:hypothetical protein [bacterium]
MGLAASQARLLTITARKADCEFLSMNLSHQKLALSRSMERVSSEYQDSLNKTKLVYDYYGAGDSDMALTYGLLMSPSVYNDYYPKLVSDSKNRIVLNSAYAQAARAAGIPAEGLLGTPSSDVRNKFVESLANYGIITPTQAVSIQGVPYNNALGLGNGVSASTSLTEITYDELLEMIEAQGVDSETYGIKFGGNWPNHGGTLYLTKEEGATYDKKDDGGNVTISELLNKNKDITLSLYSQKGEQLPITGAELLQNIVGGDSYGPGLLDWMLDQFANVLGGTAASETALQYAYNSVYDLIYPSEAVDKTWDDFYKNHGNTLLKDRERKDRANDTDHDDDGKAFKTALDELAVQVYYKEDQRDYYDDINKNSKNYIGFTYTWNKERSDWNIFHQDRKDRSQIQINISNVAQAFLTSYVQYMEGLGDSKLGWQKGNISDSTLYDPEHSDFMFTIVSDTEVDMGDSHLYANFYDTLFNQICVNGWTENAQIDDQEYMSEMLKSGMVFISSMSEDGYYYQGNYTTDRNILEVADEEAIAKAEAKYNTEKAKIENKEQTIDLKMKNLDTEISSLTTEYDTTKSIISKAIEKGFKRYEA